MKKTLNEIYEDWPLLLELESDFLAEAVYYFYTNYSNKDTLSHENLLKILIRLIVNERELKRLRKLEKSWENAVDYSRNKEDAYLYFLLYSHEDMSKYAGYEEFLKKGR